VGRRESYVDGEKDRANGKAAKAGRLLTPEEVREVVLKLARENSWGYTRILGELKKLDVRKICRSTVVKILKENGLDPGPRRGQGRWDEFLRIHAKTLWATDFFSTKVWTTRGLVDVFVLFFLHVGSRKVFVTGLTPNPDKAWIVQQARNAALFFADHPEKPRYLLRDHDTKYVLEFDQRLESEGIEVKVVGPGAPNMNAYAERFVQSIW
jgi:putative transposase